MGLGHIVGSVRALREGGRKSALTVAASLAFSSYWLIPRIGRFYAAQPDTELRLVTSDAEADWLSDTVDATVIFGTPNYPGFRPQRLFGDEILAVASPDYLAATPPAASAAALSAEALIHMDPAYSSWIDWGDWFALCGLAPAGALTGRRFNNYAMALQATRDGLGVALGWRRLIEPELKAGSLVRAAPETVVPDDAYHLLIPESRSNDRKTAAFRDWIVAEARRDWA